MSKAFVRRATCGQMTGRGLYSIHYESSHGPKDIIYNAFVRAGQKLAVECIWLAGWILDMPDLEVVAMKNNGEATFQPEDDCGYS